MREIQLTKGYVAYVDDADYEIVSAHKWWAKVKKTRVCAHARVEGRCVHLHRFILQAPIGIEVDHIDHNALNNVRDNLRLATGSQNKHNRRTGKNNTSGVKGVSWEQRREKWRCHVKFNGKQYHVGYFSSLGEAAEAVRIKRLELHGSFSCDE